MSKNSANCAACGGHGGLGPEAVGQRAQVCPACAGPATRDAVAFPITGRMAAPSGPVRRKPVWVLLLLVGVFELCFPNRHPAAYGPGQAGDVSDRWGRDKG